MPQNRTAGPRCGPLGGILTAMKHSRSDALVFLSCDMPFLSGKLIRKLIRQATQSCRAAFFADSVGVGFPFLLWKENLAQVEEQIRKASFSLQALARALQPILARPTRAEQTQRFNVNTPSDWQTARKQRQPENPGTNR